MLRITVYRLERGGECSKIAHASPQILYKLFWFEMYQPPTGALYFRVPNKFKRFKIMNRHANSSFAHAKSLLKLSKGELWRIMSQQQGNSKSSFCWRCSLW